MRRFNAAAVTLLLTLAAMVNSGRAGDNLDDLWRNPPEASRLRAYWWWLNGNVTRKSITHDLEEMKAKGFGGAVIVDANGASQEGNLPVPHGPTFMTPAWRKLYKHTLHEASRLGLEIDLNIQSGWNLGGPVVTPDDAAKKYVWSETRITGGKPVERLLPKPAARDHYYRDTFVVAYRLKDFNAHLPLENFRIKALQASLGSASAPDSSPLFAETVSRRGEEDADTNDVLDLTGRLGRDGVLRWNAPPGEWQVLRFGFTIGDHSYVSTCSEGWSGYALDVYDAGAFNRYWDAVVEPLIADAGPLAGRTLKYLHTDSWEIELANWTKTLPEEFKKRHGYDMRPWLPVLAGRIIDSRGASDRFLADYRKTLGDLAIDNHYRLFRDRAHQHGLLIHPESGGPHAVPIDAQRCLGWDDAPMSEFWAWSWEHRVGDSNRFFVKQPASAAHTYGHRYVYAEGFTDLGPHWQESIWSNLKPSFDKALCEGMNMLVWHAFVCSPEDTGLPGQQYFAGTHMNPKVTWWEKSKPFLSYLNRCQTLLQQGKPMADVLYYYGDHVPNFAQLKSSDPAHILPGYDYDVITAEALTERAQAGPDGKIVLTDGMSYRVLVLPENRPLSEDVKKKVTALEAGGVTVVTNHGAREALKKMGVLPDFEWTPAGENDAGAQIDYIHRQAAGAEIYFVANRSSNAVALNCAFRVAGLAPELWDGVSGTQHFAAAYSEKDGRTTLPLHLNPCGSTFVVFREPAAQHPATASVNWPQTEAVAELSGPWQVHFNPRWGGPKKATFRQLTSWTDRPEPGIRFYSGTAVYRREFDLPAAAAGKVLLDIGEVRELAEVRVNGRACGITWTPPFRVDITDAVQPGKNALEIEVVNFWPNRIIGDQFEPPNKRLTRTNIRKLTRNTPLMESGLLGPVLLLTEKDAASSR